MKKLKIIFTLFGLILSNDIVEFKYGLLLESADNPNQFTALEDSALVYTGDKIRINIASHGYSFYIIYVSADNQYQKIYSHHSTYSKKELYDNALKGATLSEPSGWDVLYFINSKEQLIALERTLKRYERAKGKVQEKLGKKIQSILDNLNPNSREITYFTSRLDEPVLGGVSTRGDDDQLSRFASTHSCKGNEQIALKKIVLNHQKK
tara:strand:+ start:162 stop:785 length:624 start_codon:yes stop_codon:yes gene_type:complete